MLVEHVDLQDADLRAVLLPRLRDRVFHVTSQENFEKIREAGAILHNRDERFPLNVTSEASFGRRRGWVCLFDLRGCVERVLDRTLDRDYNFLQPRSFVRYLRDSTISNIAYLIVKQEASPSIVPQSFANEIDPLGHYVRDTEVWYPGDVPLSLVESALLVTIRAAAPSGHARVFHDLAYMKID